tara:strand:+ start:257 stop:856 length:600 start_codon:yes stop_codon:yes gene_type:complete
MKDRTHKIYNLYKIASETISEHLSYHIDNDISVIDNIFRPTSNSWFDLISEAKNNLPLIKLSFDEEEIMKTDIGNFGIDPDTGERVPLDLPLPNEDFFEKQAAEYKGREVKLNRPMRSSGPKKYKVYVKNPKTGRVKKINFGDSKGGLRLNIHDAAARRSFVARHKCKKKKDKMKAGYWACRIGRYPHLVGGKKRYTWW